MTDKDIDDQKITLDKDELQNSTGLLNTENDTVPELDNPIIQNTQKKPVKKICFISSLYADSIEKADKLIRFKKNPKYDYKLFTNLDTKKLKTSWELIYLPLSHLKTNNIRKSRYPKFLIWEYFQKVDTTYDMIVYMDAFYIPKLRFDWERFIPIVKKNHAIFSKHPRNCYSELRNIVSSKKDTLKNMRKMLKFLLSHKMPPGKLMSENTLFIYNPDSIKYQNLSIDFWKSYIKCPSHRDQPLLSYFFWKNNFTPVVYQKKYLSKKPLHLEGCSAILQSKGFKNHKYC